MVDTAVPRSGLLEPYEKYRFNTVNCWVILAYNAHSTTAVSIHAINNSSRERDGAGASEEKVGRALLRRFKHRDCAS